MKIIKGFLTGLITGLIVGVILYFVVSLFVLTDFTCSPTKLLSVIGNLLNDLITNAIFPNATSDHTYPSPNQYALPVSIFTTVICTIGGTIWGVIGTTKDIKAARARKALEKARILQQKETDNLSELTVLIHNVQSKLLNSLEKAESPIAIPTNYDSSAGEIQINNLNQLCKQTENLLTALTIDQSTAGGSK